MRKVIFIILIFISLITLGIRFSSKPLAEVLNIKQRSGVRIDANLESRVFINSQEVGKTPYQDDDLFAGDYLVELKPTQEGSPLALYPWRGYVRLNKGTLTVVNREIGNSPANSSGEVITLEPGKGVTIISAPDKSDVEIDGKYYGKTPLTVEDILPGEHLFLISHPNFLKRNIRANLVEGYKLNLSVDLAISEPDLTKIATEPVQTSSILVVKNTPVGFLRVRRESTVTSQQIAQLRPGDRVTLLEELPNWSRIKLPDGREGYVASVYLDKRAE